MINKKLKKSLVEFGIFGAVMLTLFLTGLHTEVFGFLQRGLLATGLMDPDVELREENKVESNNTRADYNLRLINSKGEQVNLEHFRGKVVFLNIWATWCPPCVAEMPGINKLYNELQDDKEIVFLMLSVDDDFSKAKRFKEKKGFDFEVFETLGNIPRMYQSQSIPTTYVINAKGELVLTHMGMADYYTSEFKEFLQSHK